MLGAIAAALFATLSLHTDKAAAQAAPAAPVAELELPANNVGANLNVSPKRVTFDRADRSATVYIFNQGTAPATFDVVLVDRVMLPDGQIVPADEAATKPEDKPYLDLVKSAKSMLIVSPRRATLLPGKGQTVRIRAAASTDDAVGPPPAGEYRTHLTVTTIPPRDTGLTAEQAAGSTGQGLRFQINSVFGLSIPVIVRIGAPDIRGEIADVKLSTQTISSDGVAPARPTSVLTLQLVRIGPNSLFGNLEVRGSKDKSADPLGLARGVGVYPEIGKRQVQIPLKRAPMPGEQLEISFKDDDTAPGRLVAKTTFNTP
jgi:P pilus assembly chaperone PapD